MSTKNTDPELLAEEIDEKQENIKSWVQEPKVSRFGPSGFQNGSKFGKGPMGNSNPQLKQRPWRAAARGR
jgi:hypothetical protein